MTAAVTGISVSVSYHVPLAYASDDPGNTINVLRQGGKLVRYQISNDAVTRTDTIYSGICAYPMIDIAGSRVAFFATGLRIEWNTTKYPNTPGWHVVAGTESNPNYLLMMNIDGTGLCTLQTFSSRLYPSATDGYLDGPVADWPAGDYIYFEEPTKSAKIDKVNVRTRQSSFVYNYSNPNPFLRRFSTSLDGSLAAIQGLYCHDNQPQYITCFPAVNCSYPCVKKTECCCNIQLSASGQYYAYYLGGEHEDCFVAHMLPGTDYWGNSEDMAKINVADLASWSGFNLTSLNATGGYYIRWAVNSDKWFMQENGFCGQYPSRGSNQTICNWVDKKALVVTKNAPPSSCGGSGGFSKCSCPGDFWVQPPTGYTTAYEDPSGAWRQMTVSQMEPAPKASIQRKRFTVQKEAGAFLISVPGPRTILTIQVADIAGRSVFYRTGSGPVRIPIASMPYGACILRVSEGNIEINERILPFN
jgi:hypothetical protein